MCVWPVVRPASGALVCVSARRAGQGSIRRIGSAVSSARAPACALWPGLGVGGARGFGELLCERRRRGGVLWCVVSSGRPHPPSRPLPLSFPTYSPSGFIEKNLVHQSFGHCYWVMVLYWLCVSFFLWHDSEVPMI